jgi:pSer/pThr/pTyr-binding forkhead associated (FHA) protein
MASKFLIIRKDLDVDPTTLESDGLTIGRLVSNDLTLNHPAVSRTHAGIKEVGSDYWIFNLSNANGTILNDSTVDSSPLAAGDVIKIGPFTIFVSFAQSTITLSVELSVNPLRAEDAGATTALTVDQSGKTMMLTPQGVQAQQQKATPGGTQRLSLTGKLTGLMGKPEEFALQVFWDKRKRDAGKMAEATPLKPNLLRGRVGKARFNWRSSSDLRRPWPVSLFIWGALVVTVLSVATVFAFKNAYSPGPLSDPHRRSELAAADPAVAVAKTANSNSCTTCHSLTGSTQAACTECHTTAGFKSSVSHEHEMAGLSCSECHGSQHLNHGALPGMQRVDDRGVIRESDQVVLAKDSCTACHRTNYVYHSAALGKDITLDTPHGGSEIGYPVSNGQWTWAGWSEEKWKQHELPKTASAYDTKGQFHILHVSTGSPQERVQCSDCHTAGFEPANITKGVHESCARCHGAAPDPLASNVSDGSKPAAAGTECTSCHQQHIAGKDPVALVRARQLASK